MAACNTSAVQYNRNFIADFHVLCTGYDLNRLRTDIHLADDEFVGIRMRFNALKLSYDDFLKIFVKSCITFSFGA